MDNDEVLNTILGFHAGRALTEALLSDRRSSWYILGLLEALSGVASLSQKMNRPTNEDALRELLPESSEHDNQATLERKQGIRDGLNWLIANPQYWG